MIWLHVADMDETLKRVTAHGGKISEPPSPDGPERTLATIMKTSRAAKPSPAPRPAILLQAEQARGSPPDASWLHVIL